MRQAKGFKASLAQPNTGRQELFFAVLRFWRRYLAPQSIPFKWTAECENARNRWNV